MSRETESVTTRQTIRHFGNVDQITVYPGDVLLKRVVESDGGREGSYELYDFFATAVPRQVLEAGTSQMRSRKVRFLELKFRRLERSGHAGESQSQRGSKKFEIGLKESVREPLQMRLPRSRNRMAGML